MAHDPGMDISSKLKLSSPKNSSNQISGLIKSPPTVFATVRHTALCNYALNYKKKKIILLFGLTCSFQQDLEAQIYAAVQTPLRAG